MKKATALEFHTAINEAITLMGDEAMNLDKHPLEFYQTVLDNGGTLFLSNTNDYGVMVNDGFIGSLFKTPTANSFAFWILLETAVDTGGYVNDAFGTHLEDLYIRADFKPVARVRFNDAYAPTGWEKTALKSRPDVVIFIYDPNEQGIKGGGVYFNEYDDALAYAKTLKK